MDLVAKVEGTGNGHVGPGAGLALRKMPQRNRAAQGGLAWNPTSGERLHQGALPP
jgi:hypothetical protein